MASEIRQQRYRELIKEELGKILFDYLDVEPGVLVTVTRADISEDLFHVTVWVSVFPTGKAEGIMGRLQKSIFDIQQLFNRKMRVRPVPKIRFEFDKNPEEAGHIEELLEKTKEHGE